ncbi:hypothetical protein G6F46_007490 [Rhizopus delemar]|uniref:Uncharacterized protein n=1 Tax=Rhizopus oryzae TaxID=64495 RepID=A0A9P6Y987_RHIOR|nr:hypothetical protein G6F51_007669 [Rhizopus arrhizus]KAG1554854.1 hypothetical protein G6F49_007659 [Rhizopus delemar]KAG1596693.1 hypothetical protein G6F47_007973 [Rhizopus delemar]KAG1613727.1 hypothetical protein G6F46_007490 [Rhizopus delemar]
MTLSFQTNIPSSNLLPPKRLTWHLRKVKDDKKVATYRQVFTNLTADLIPPSPPLLPDRSSAINYIEDFNSAICQAIYQSLDQVCGKSDQQKDTELQKFWTIELQDTFNLKEYYYRKWRKAQGLNRLKYWLLHQETKALLRRMVLRRRRETWHNFCERMEQGEYTKSIARFCKIRKNRNLKPSFTTLEGPQHAVNLMASHLKSIYAGHLLHETEPRLNIHQGCSATITRETCPRTLQGILPSCLQNSM